MAASQSRIGGAASLRVYREDQSGGFTPTAMPSATIVVDHVKRLMAGPPRRSRFVFRGRECSITILTVEQYFSLPEGERSGYWECDGLLFKLESPETDDDRRVRWMMGD